MPNNVMSRSAMFDLAPDHFASGAKTAQPKVKPADPPAVAKDKQPDAAPSEKPAAAIASVKTPSLRQIADASLKAAANMRAMAATSAAHVASGVSGVRKIGGDIRLRSIAFRNGVASVWSLMMEPLTRIEPKRFDVQAEAKPKKSKAPRAMKLKRGVRPTGPTGPVDPDAVSETDYDMIVANRLSRAGRLSPDEWQAAASTGRSTRRTHQAGDSFVVEGERLKRPIIIVSGLACSMRVLPNGRRQFVSFLLPGDGVGLGHNVGVRSSTTVLALTTVQAVDASALHELACRPGHEGLASALCGLALHNEEFHLNQMARLAMRSRSKQLAHLLSELRWRFQAAGLAMGSDMPLPITFETLGEALGVSAEKAWAVMLRLKATGHARFKWGRATILRPRALQKWGEFRPPQVYEARSMAPAVVEPPIAAEAVAAQVVAAVTPAPGIETADEPMMRRRASR